MSVLKVSVQDVEGIRVNPENQSKMSPKILNAKRVDPDNALVGQHPPESIKAQHGLLCPNFQNLEVFPALRWDGL
jgi:hypothetical protein